MKKSRLIVIGLVAALLLTGIAFAAWTASVDVNVNAKSGELDVQITSRNVVSASDYVKFSRKNIEISEDKKTATVSIDNLYPGSEAVFTVNVKNVGTLPVELTKLTHAAIKVLDKNTNASYGLDAEIFKYFNAEYTASIVDKKGITLKTLAPVDTATLSNWVEDVYVDNNLPEIEPGQSLVLKVKVYLDKEAEDNTENKLFRFSVTPLFGQTN